MKFRYAGLWAPLLAAVFAVVLTPSVALAAPNPNNNGHHYHYGWINHHSPPPAPAPNPGGGPGTNGPSNSIVTVVSAAVGPQAPTVIPPDTPVLGPPAGMVATAQPVLEGRNAWLVAILLATLVAAIVTLAVLAAGRAGHYAITRTFASVGIRV